MYYVSWDLFSINRKSHHRLERLQCPGVYGIRPLPSQLLAQDLHLSVILLVLSSLKRGLERASM